MAKVRSLKWMVRVSIAALSSSTIYGADDDTQYKGSQAFNQFLSSMESVNPNTGTLGITKPLVNLSGVNKKVNLKLDLVYSPGYKGILGLPQNWGFSLGYIMGSSLTCQGRSYIIDDEWADETGYKSGLRYINNHGLRFDTVMPDRPLPSGNGTYRFCLTDADGSHDYFDATGKLVEHDDRFGNSITYSYNSPGGGIEENYLTQIVDSYGQTINFSYMPNQITVQLPGNESVIILYSESGVLSIENEARYKTSFSYDGSGNIVSVSYPTGLQSIFEYTNILYKDKSGTQKSLSAVSNLKHQDSKGDLLEWTQYSYSFLGDSNNFTGYPNYYLSNGSDKTDTLMDSGDTLYIYEVLTSGLDPATQNLLTATSASYNWLHLPITEKKYLDMPKGNWYQTDYAYDIYSKFARTTNYNKPVTIESSLYLNGQQARKLNQFCALDQSGRLPGYDLYGNLRRSQKSFYDSSGNPVPQTLNVWKFKEVNWDNGPKRTMPKTARSEDLITGYQKLVTYVLTSDNKNIESKSAQYGLPGSQNFLPWKTTSYAYDDKGRMTLKTLAWTDQDPDHHPRSILSTADRFSYQYEYKSGTYNGLELTVTHTDALGNKTTTVYGLGIPGSPVLQMTSPLGHTIKHDYDLLVQ